MKKNRVYREKLTDFVDRQVCDVRRKEMKRFGFDARRQSLKGPRFEQLQLESPSSCNTGGFQLQPRVNGFWDPQRSVREFGALPLFSFSEDPVVCPNCGHVDIVGHGPAEHKVLQDQFPLNPASQNTYSNHQKALAQASVLIGSNNFKPTRIAPSSWTRRWKCKRCGITFRWGVDKGLKYPFELWDVTLSSFVEGDDMARINDEVGKEAKRRGIKVKTISSEATYSIVQRSYETLAKFEPIAIRKLTDREVKLGTVQIDYSPYPIYTTGSRIKQLDLKNKNINFHDLSGKELKRLGIRKRVFTYITGAIDEESHYPPPMATGLSFDYRYSLKCLEQMIQTFGGKPDVIKCDGAFCHRNAVKMLLPDVELYSRTKKQCYNIVNILERYWHELKDECMHPYRFMSLGTVQLAVEFKRLEHVFLRPHSTLKGMTPAQFLGIKIPRSIIQNKSEKWRRLLKLAHNTIMMEKCPDLRKF
jgi:hypothetical protein